VRVFYFVHFITSTLKTISHFSTLDPLVVGPSKRLTTNHISNSNKLGVLLLLGSSDLLVTSLLFVVKIVCQILVFIHTVLIYFE